MMSLTNAISAIAVVGSIVITGANHPLAITLLGAATPGPRLPRGQRRCSRTPTGW
jgi:hypothetical protein